MRPTSERARFVLATRLFLLLLLSAVSFARLDPSRQDAQGQRVMRGGSDPTRDRAPPRGSKHLIGIGKADITGPIVDLVFVGYAHDTQVGNGLRQRLYSRAFIIGDAKNPKDRVIYVVMDSLVGDTAVRLGVLEGLKDAGDEYSVYGSHNLALAAVHSHATPGSWWNYFLPSIPNNGFDKQSYEALVQGTLLAIKRAHSSLQEGYLDVGTTEIMDAAINRSLFAYLHNPEEERQKYQSETDKTMTLLRFRRASDMKNIGLLTWFPVHGTALYNNNTHVSGDNKGLAAWMTEKAMKNDDSAADGFIAAFSQANLADATPNIEGAWCEDGSGERCSLETASCPNGKVTGCHGRGPMFREQDLGVSSCHEIARRQATAATELLASMDSSSTPIAGTGVKGFHFFHNMAWWKFNLPNGTEVMTCPAALGYSFAAGTTDGPGLFDFIQGEANRPRNPLWKIVFGFLRIPTLRQKNCQSPKPILFDGGEQHFPYAWEPNIVDISMFRIGQLVIILSPSEVSTMSGRRWKAAVAREAANFIDNEPIVVVASPANTYAHYLTTQEEYAVQRYEGAATIFGQHSLNAYINLTVGSTFYLEPGSTDLPDPGELPPDNRKRAFNFNFAFGHDGTPMKRSFGDVISQPAKNGTIGDDFQATFQAASPRNNLRLGETYAAVEQIGPDGNWTRVRDDEDWFLVYNWRRTSKFLGHSEVDITWETKGNAEPGTYRLKYYGDAKPLVSDSGPFEGTSDSFELRAKDQTEGSGREGEDGRGGKQEDGFRHGRGGSDGRRGNQESDHRQGREDGGDGQVHKDDGNGEGGNDGIAQFFPFAKGGDDEAVGKGIKEAIEQFFPFGKGSRQGADNEGGKDDADSKERQDKADSKGGNEEAVGKGIKDGIDQFFPFGKGSKQGAGSKEGKDDADGKESKEVTGGEEGTNKDNGNSKGRDDKADGDRGKDGTSGQERQEGAGGRESKNDDNRRGREDDAAGKKGQGGAGGKEREDEADGKRGKDDTGDKGRQEGADGKERKGEADGERGKNNVDGKGSKDGSPRLFPFR